MFTARSATLPLALFTLVFFCGTLFLPVFSRIVEIPSTLDFKRFLLIGAMITSVLTLSLAKQLRYTPISLKTSLVLLVFFSCGLISTWWSPYPYWSLVDLANYGFLLLAFFLLNICITSCTPSVVCRWMFWVTCLFSIIFFCEYFAKFAVMMFESKRVGTSSLIAGFENPRMFNQLQVMLVPLLLQPFFLPSSLNKKYLAMALMAGHWMVLFQTEARGAVLALTLAFGLAQAFCTREQRRIMLKIYALSLFIGLLLWLIVLVLIPLAFVGNSRLALRTDSSGRLEMWLLVLQQLPSNLWFGNGPMSFAWAPPTTLVSAHPHNASLQLLYEYGLLACLPFALWVMYKLASALKSMRRVAHSPFYISVLISVVAAAIYAQLTGFIVVPFTQLMLITILALFHAIARDINRPVLNKMPFAVLALTVAGFVLSSYQHQQFDQTERPRLWQFGLLAPK